MLRKTQELCNSDRTYLAFTGLGFLGGTVFLCLLAYFPYAFLPSVFFGTGIASLVYRFMGGIKSGELSSKGKAIQIGGTLGSFLACVTTINSIVDSQNYHSELSIEPNKSSLVIANENGKLETLKIEGRHLKFSGKLVNTIPIESNKDVVESFLKRCWQGQGICKSEPKQAVIFRNSDVPQGTARVCQNRRDDFYQFPLLINERGNLIRVNHDLNLANCDDSSEKSIRVYLNPKDLINEEGADKTKGTISIAPLSDVPMLPGHAQVAQKN